MGYCTYGGKRVPGNNQASCVGGGGNWVGGETGPGSQLGGTPMPGFNAWDKPSDSPTFNTDDFGNPLNTNFEGGANFGTLRDRAVNKNNTSVFNAPSRGPVARNTTADPRTTQTYNGVRPMTSQEMGAQDSYNAGQKIKGIFGADDQSKAAAMQSKTPLNTGIPISPNPYTGQRGPVKGKRVVNNSSGTSSIGAMLQPNIGPRDKDGIFGQSSANKLGGGVADKDNKEYVPEKKEEIESGLSGLWSNMQKPGYWSEQVEGGSGKWDNRLFRLGEMMAHMGTPLSKRGDNPSKRWTSASSAAATLKASANKAKKTPTPLKIDNVGGYITKKMDDDAGSGVFNWNGMSTKEIEAASAIINTNITKKVRSGELAIGEGNVDIRKIADEEIAKYLKAIGK